MGREPFGAFESVGRWVDLEQHSNRTTTRSIPRPLEWDPGHDGDTGWPALASIALQGAAARVKCGAEERRRLGKFQTRALMMPREPRCPSIHAHTLRLTFDRPIPTPTAAAMAKRPPIQPPTGPVAPFDFAAAALLRDERARQMLAAEEVRVYVARKRSHTPIYTAPEAPLIDRSSLRPATRRPREVGGTMRRRWGPTGACSTRHLTWWAGAAP